MFINDFTAAAVAIASVDAAAQHLQPNAIFWFFLCFFFRNFTKIMEIGAPVCPLQVCTGCAVVVFGLTK